MSRLGEREASGSGGWNESDGIRRRGGGTHESLRRIQKI